MRATRVVELLRRRRAGRQTTAFVLSGGGNLGAIQVGMLRALVERDVVPDVVVGSSVGAINGAAIAFDPTVRGARRLEVLWRGIDGKELCPPFRVPLPVQLVRRGRLALHPNDGLAKVIRDALGDTRFEDLPVPFHCVATSLDRRRPQWFTSGPLAAPLLASGAIPGVFPPVAIEGERYVDGAVVYDVPLQRAVEVGATKLYVLYTGNLDRPHPPAGRPLDIALESSWIARANWYHLSLDALPAGVEVIVLPTGRTPLLRYDDFSHTVELIARGYELASAFLEGRPAETAAAPEEAVEEGEMLA